MIIDPPSPIATPARARMGRDAPNPALKALIEVSIHAPAWGATGVTKAATALGLFRSTRPHGARLWNYFAGAFVLGFDPRARMGRDAGEYPVRTP